jgi:hypothetical protein
MKPINFKILVKTTFLFALATMMVVSFFSCATKATFATSSVVPAAQGIVTVKKDKNNNYSIRIHIENLDEVTMLEPSKRTYVIWLVSNKAETRNIGQVNSSSGTFSDKLKVYFETVSSYKPSKIFITAEDDATILHPGTQVVLATNRF